MKSGDPQSQPARGHGWLAVLGMHRSGTSAITEVISRLGLDLPRDLLAADTHNPRGYFESASLIEMNDLLLQSVGTTAWGPPTDDSFIKVMNVDAAGSTFRAVSETMTRPWAWKDPRLSLTLQYWRSVEPPRAAVLSWRDPREVASSLRRRDDTPTQLAIALWHRYNQAALAACRGLPTLVVDSTLLRRDPLALATTLSEFIAEVFPTTSLAPATQSVAGFEGRLLRRLIVDLDSMQSAIASEMTELLTSVSGSHPKLLDIEVPSLPEWAVVTIDVHRNADLRRFETELHLKSLLRQARVQALLDSNLGVQDIHRLSSLKDIVGRVPLLRSVARRLFPAN